MGGKTGTTTQSVSIPPEVLARYNAVNTQAQQVAATPFQPYTGQFVAGLTPTQQAGIQATSQASQAAQPYYDAATGQLMAAQQGAMPGISAAYQNVGQAQDVGSQYAQAASQYYGGAANAAMPYYGMMQQGVGGALSYAQPMNYMAQQTAAGAMGQSLPFYGAMGQGIGSALQYAQPLNYQAQQAATTAQQQALPFYGAMGQGIGSALGYAQPLNYQAQQAAGEAAQQAMPYYGAATAGTVGALEAAQPYQQAAGQGLGAALQYSGGINAMTPQMALAALGQTQPIMGQALAGTQGAVQAGQPFQGMATQAAMAGAQGVNPEALNIGAYMSPYTQAVADATYRTMRQQQEQEMSGQLANAIRSGAFGGDRAALAATNLARQQELATAQAMAPIYQQGYGQALAAAQQQQGVGLSAAQANRAALQNLSAQLQGIGQQGYAQQLGAAGQIGQLGQNIYGQGIGAAQALSGLGQTGFSQQLQQAQALAALGQQGYGQQLGAAQQLGQIGQNIYGMGANQANLLSQLGQTGYGQQLGAAQALGQLGQNIYGMGANQANLLSQLGQTGYGQQLGAAQQYGALGQNLYNMAANQANLYGQLGQLGYGQQLGAAQQYGNIGQNLYQMGLGTGQAYQGLGQQQYAQGLGAAQQLAALAQQGYGMGSTTAQQLAALGTGAQQSALQGAQAQLGAGTLEQQTQQADLTARYQQFLQERGYPFQVAQFLANIAMGTGALSGQTTTTTQPMPFFSDRRVKHDVKEIGETHDGQPIYSFKYNGDDRTQIGLMAQDVEKKHPEAVYDIDGIKGVDYHEATKDAARPERYEGGIVPESQGGAVINAPAFGRHGYALDGGVNPNDLQQILAQQREAMGPYAEGGIYGVSQHGSPFESANAIVPKTRLHIPSMREADTPPPMPEGAGSQAVKLFDETMAMKNRYDAAKNLIRTRQEEMDQTRQGQTGTSRKNLAGPDIVPDKNSDEEKGIFGTLASMFGYADGGLVPRHGYAMGAYIDPYEKAKGYFPEESLEESNSKELKKAGQTPEPKSQTGLGVGDVVSLGLKLIPFLPFANGGVVPRGHMADGGVYDPTMGRIVSTEMSPIEELEKEDIYSRELQPAAAPRFRVFERVAREEGAKGVKPTELYRSPERSAMLDLTMPEGAPRAKPYQSGHNYGLAVDYSGTTPENYDAIRKAAAATGLTSGLDFRNVDPPHIQLGKGGYGGLYGRDIAIDEGFGQRSQSGVVPAEAQEAAYAAARAERPNLPADRASTASGGVKPPAESEGKGMMESMRDYLAKNQSLLVPLGAGLRGMVQSKSPFLGGALLEGIGTGLEAVGGAQKQLADIALTQAQKEEAMSRIPRYGEVEGLGFFLVRQPDGNYAWVRRGEYKPSMGARVDPSMVPANQIPPVPVAAEDKSAEAKVAAPKIEAPKIVSSGQIAQLDPISVDAINKEIDQTKNINPAEKNDFVTPAVNEGASASKLSYDLNTYGGALSMLPKDSMIAGSVFAPLAIEGKKAIDQILDEFGLKDYVYDVVKPDMTGINFAEEVAKIKSALSTGRTGEAGQRAVSAIDKFGEMFPDITTSFEGRRDNTASILVRNMQDIERGMFAENWRAETAKSNPGYANRFSDGMNFEFERLTQDQYRADKETLKKMFETTMPNGQTWLYYLTTLKQPLTSEQIDFINQKFKNPSILRYFPNIRVQ